MRAILFKLIRLKWSAVICLTALLFFGTQVSAATINVSTIATLQTAINSAVEGDIIVLADGTYNNSTITLSRRGITVRSATPGGVFLSGTAAVFITGTNNTFSGFQFTSGSSSAAVIDVTGNNNLMTQLNFNEYAGYQYFRIRAGTVSNQITYCNIENKPLSATISTTIQVSTSPTVPGYHKIRYCSFKNFPGPGGDYGNEPIRIGLSTEAGYTSRSMVEYCYFNNVGLGDDESISVKSCENIVRYCTFDNNPDGMLVFRHGNRNIAYGNFFVNNSGGIRVKEGNSHFIYNNYFATTTANSLQLEYVAEAPLTNINFIHNTFVEPGPIDLGGTGPKTVTFANNIFTKSSGSIFFNPNGATAFAGNIYQGTLGITIPSGMLNVDPQLALNPDGYYGLSSSSPAIDAASTSYPSIVDITNVDDDPTLTMDISRQARPVTVSLKDVGCDEYGVNSTNRPLTLSDVGPSYLGGPVEGNASPSVSLTSPANGATFEAPASIAMTASASDMDGTIAKVDFYNGTTLLGTDTTSPYAYTWTGVMAGSYSLTAKATDNNNAVSISVAVAITVTTIAPVTNTYTTAGVTTWACPANVTSVTVQCWGGGGAGGSAFRDPAGGSTQNGGGGAGGAYAKDNSYPVTPGNTYYINVGAGGTNRSIVNDTVVAGGDSWFNFINSPSTTIIAKGGAGGQSAVGNTTNTAFGTGGTGTAVGSIGDVVYAGGSGASVPSVTSYGGGGGGSGGTASAGNSAVPNSGTGATAVTGGGNGGNPNPVAGSSASGQTPTIPPGGGGGGARDGSELLRSGGTGCVGRVVLIYAATGGGSGNIAPVFTADPISKAGATEDVSYTGQTLAGSATDADGDTLSYSVQAGPAWLSIASNGALSGTPANADVGVNSWSVQVSDGNGGTDTAILNITVANVNDAPVFTVDPMSRANASVGVAYSQTISGSATDVDAGATLTYSKVSGPTWLSIATSGALTGTPAATNVGVNSWTVQVSDGLGGTDTAVLNITVNVASAPTFVAAGAVAGGTGTIIPGLPSGITAGDILLLFVETANQACSISNPNGGTWAAVAASPQGTGTAGGTAATMLTAFWSRYNGTQGAPTVSDSGDHTIGRMIAIRGATASGDPWNVTAGGVEATSDTSASIPGATTTVDNTLVVVAVSGSLPDATSTAIFSGWANANLTGLTERTDNANKSNNGGALGVATGVKAVAGACGNTTVTHSSAAVKGMMSIAIKN